jgi:hypothetical protein
MSTISIGNLNSIGSDLLLDQESYLDNLSDELTANVKGGVFFTTTATPASPQISAAAVTAFSASAAFTYAVTRTFGK